MPVLGVGMPVLGVGIVLKRADVKYAELDRYLYLRPPV